MVVRSWREEPLTVLHAVGDLDVAGAPRLQAALDQVLASADPPKLVLDLTDVPFCDSVGLGVLVSTHSHVQHAHGRFMLVLAPGMISHLLTITNLDRHFETCSSLLEARAALGAAA
ncbi:STAS domain-containing protein [Nonomuraea aurantiaca]|uniref:STAS domain-containing protein n=1 Tax=Nonomuraea aurantiaca TaxID=2878562 RepID=UPI001CD9BB6A|nr:STAS domain-containing protein [Nonomuraea aurantiaca]MCA2225607.1 STAS domain-containing protein [Nonomuraea aurantiaca]